MQSDDTTRRWLEQSRAAWDERADMFNELSTANSRADDRKSELDFVSGALGLRPGSRVLDAGCGAGHFAIAFAERDCVAQGIDLSPELVARARRNAADAGVEIELTVGDLLPLSASDGAYDAIVSRMVLQFVPHLSAVLDEFERVTASGGALWLSVPGALSPIYRHSWKRFLADEPEPMNYVTPWELIRLLEEKGWTVGEQWGSFDTIGDAGNTAAGLEIATLPLPLQQAAATVWNVIADRG
jgi:ubiquinone/menaquinone biosynthesis C-methylase UbiE